MEKWVKVVNNELEDRYYVSNTGKLKDIIDNFIYIYKSNKHQNYIHLSLKCKNGKRKRFLLHRLVAETFIPNPNNYPIINHIDEDKQNNNINNLEWCTQSHNMQCWAKNRRKGNSNV